MTDTDRISWLERQGQRVRLLHADNSWYVLGNRQQGADDWVLDGSSVRDADLRKALDMAIETER